MRQGDITATGGRASSVAMHGDYAAADCCVPRTPLRHMGGCGWGYRRADVELADSPHA